MAATTYSKILYAGTYANYQAITTKDANVLYFCTDNGKLYKGEVDFTDNFIATTSSSVPSASAAVAGKIYYTTDTKKFITLLNGSMVEIGNPIDASVNSTTSISSTSADDHVPSSLNVWYYGQQIKNEVIGGSDVVKSVAAGTTASVVITKGDDTTTEVSLAKVVTQPSWDSTNLKLTLPVQGGTDVEVNIPKDIFLADGTYDITNRQIVLTLNDPSHTEIRFNVADMVDIYVAKDTTSVDTTIAWNTTSGKYEISADVNISANAVNKLSLANDGLLVDVSDLETSHNNLAAAALEWGTF